MTKKTSPPYWADRLLCDFLVLLASLSLLFLSPLVLAQENTGSELSAAVASETEPLRLEELSIIGEEEALGKTAGSAQVIDEQRLERYEYDNIHRILNDVPGVNIRGEDGYGLRPNIGLRGSTTERSQKITLMEDGVLIAPAPYSAPAAYYFPMVSRMTSVEVVKGPAAISNGPNTVGGSINLVTRKVPFKPRGGIDISYGSDAYRKTHLHYGRGGERFAWLLEGLHTGSDGFKDLDTGGDTGFEKNNLMFKALFNTDLDKEVYQQVDIKLNYADERSDETYLGLTDGDFASTPLRRYAASQNALMDWEHKQVQIKHLIEFNADLSLQTALYRHEFERSWTKLNRFSTERDGPDQNRTLSEILTNPGVGLNANFIAVLRGESDSGFAGSTLLVGTNAREYLSQGVQTVLHWKTRFAGIDQKIAFGLRYHEDEIQRNHSEDGFQMTSGQLVADGSSSLTTVNDERAKALAAYIQDEVQINHLTLTLGLRVEDIRYESDRQIPVAERKTNDNRVFLPGAGAFYQWTPTLSVLGGVHWGFVPTGPGQADDLDPEESVNYELGLRYAGDKTKAEVIGFFNDYSNLKEVCLFASGCTQARGVASNGGEIDIYGLEAALAHEWQFAGNWRVPLHLTYTFTETEFKTSFNSTFPLWGNVQEGDRLPYMPEHKLSASLGLIHMGWEGTANLSYVGKQIEQAGSGGPLAGSTLKAYTVVDLAGRWDFRAVHALYLKIDNALDKSYILSRRPFGARPGKPRTFGLGYKYSF